MSTQDFERLVTGPIDWRRELGRMLLQGVALDSALEQLVPEANRDQARAAASDLMDSPWFEDARRAVMQLGCRNWLLRNYRTLETINGAAACIDSAPGIDRDRFRTEYYLRNRPLRVPAAAVEWPAVRLWGADYFKRQCGSQSVEVMADRDSVSIPLQASGRMVRRQMTLSHFIDLVHSGRRTNDYYHVARNDFFASPDTSALLEDLGELSFVNTRSSASHIRLWYGPAGTVTTMHYDPRNGVLVQVVGTKTIRLISPHYSEFMNQTMPWYAEGVQPGRRVSGGPSGALVPEIAIRLEPGDALFIPVGWWHEVVADTVSISLNFHDFWLPNDYSPY